MSTPVGHRKGVWHPLPMIVYGYAIHPLSPTRRDTRFSTRNRLSTVTEASTDDHLLNREVVSLEVGDEVYAFEKYTPRGKETDGAWYRGYVVCTARRPPVSWSLSTDPSSSKSPLRHEEPQQVFIGIFPASHIHVRDELSDAEGRLPEVAAAALHSGANGSMVIHDSHGLSLKDRPRTTTDPVSSDGDESDGARKTFRLGPRPDQANSSRAALPVYSVSLRSRASTPDSQVDKPLPPRPSLKSGDDTISGIEQPIVDEIASALREWHTLMFQYLARRDYKLFQNVREHIETLHSGRRQLLAKTLSAEETANLRRDCVARLVSGNIAQGLDVIVRHPTWGGLVTVDVEGEIDLRTWVSAIRMYAMQTSLAYSSFDSANRPHTLGPNTDYVSVGPSPTPTPAHSAFPEYPRAKAARSAADPVPAKASAKFYHVFLELRAFVASPCSPGETAELFFSLYNRAETRFVTEEFCVVLNHNGVLARDPASRIRTLFTDLAQSDVQDPIYLVCRIVRNGSLKIGSTPSSSNVSEFGKREMETLQRGDSTQSDILTSPTSYSASTPVSARTIFPSEAPSQFRRPFGCAVLELTQLAQMSVEQTNASPTREHTMPIFVPTNEALFSMLHQDIIAGNAKEFEKSTRADMLAVSIKIFHGNAPIIVRENTSLLQDTPSTLRLGFPDVVFPGDVRNEIYIKLWSGDFSTSHGGSGRLSVVNFRGQMGPSGNNVQVTVEVRDQDGRPVENVISQGSGEAFMTQFNSMVFQRCNQPTFGELIKIQLPLQGIPQWHLFFTFRNRNGKERPGSRDLGERPFAFAFQPLFPENRAFLEDGSHMLLLYRADKMTQLTPEMYLASTPWLTSGQKVEQIPVSPDMQRLAPPIRDTLTIRSSLCSTKFTQNPVLLKLLNWEKLGNKELLSTILTKFTFVGEGEIVKFLRDIFDSLFGILISNNNQSGEMDHLVFSALVTVLGIVQDRRFSNFQPVLDVYIEQHFSCAAASSHIIHSMNRLLANPTSPETASPLRAALKVWHYIFKFIARSRELQKVKELGMGGGATAEHLEATFKRDLRSHLSEVTKMMAIVTPASIIGTQTIALQYFTSILPEMAKIFSTVELVSIATQFAGAIGASKGKIIIWKLIMYLQIVKGFLFDDTESRPKLVEAVGSWIKPHFGRYDEYIHVQSTDSEAARDAARISWLESVRLCVTIIAVMLDKLQQHLVSPEIIADRRLYRQEQDNVEFLLSLLPRLLESYREFQSPELRRAVERTRSSATVISSVPVTFPESYPFSLVAYLPRNNTFISKPPIPREGEALFNPGLGETAVVLLVLISSSPRKDILDFLDASLEIEGKEKFVNLLSQFFSAAISILENNAFPKSWLNVNILAHKVLVKMMDPVASILERDFIPDAESESQFDANLWRDAFYMLLKLLSSDQLVIEEFSPQKRRAVWRLAGDIRGEGATILLRLWMALGWPEQVSASTGAVTRYGGYQFYLNSLVGHVVNLCLSHHDQLRNNAVQILYSMIVAEYQQCENFNEIEHAIVARLDSLFMSDSKGDDISRAFFVGQLRHLFESSEVDEQLRERVSCFLDSVDLFLELLLSVRALPEGEEYSDDRVIATLRLMNFIRRIGRDEIYIKYVHQLVNMHLASQNYVEAALTLKLHSDLHEWDLNSFLPPMEDIGLPQQSQFHRKETLCLLILDYLGKGKAWENAVEICKELAFQHSEVTYNYTRLSAILRHQAELLEHIVTEQRYYPDYYRVAFYGNFPVAIRGKQFIYRGFEWEKFGAFCERMLNKHPGAQLLKDMGDPPVDIRFGNDQYIQCTAVNPEPNRELPIFTNPDVPLSVRAYYEHCGVNLFSCSRPITKETPDGRDEPWLEKTYFATEEVFPTVLRRSEVVAVQVMEISPLENALQDVEQKTKELTQLNIKFTNLARSSQEISLNAFRGALNNAVEPPANSGVVAYRHTYSNPAYLDKHPGRVEGIEKLRAAILEHVRVIDACIKLYGQISSQEYVTHETLEKIFRRNFRDEIRRLGIDYDTMSNSDQVTVSGSLRSDSVATPSQYQQSVHSSLYEPSLKRSLSSTSTSRPNPPVPLLQLGRPLLTPPPLSPQSPRDLEMPGSSKTPLQRHLAHLARHGINGVASGPKDNSGSDSLSAESPQESFVNVGNGLHGVSASQMSGTSVVNSIRSMGSLKGRFSRFGSLNFGRRRGA